MQYCHFSKSKSAAALHRIAILGLAWLLVYWCLQSLYEKESYGFINKAGNWAIGFEFGTEFKTNSLLERSSTMRLVSQKDALWSSKNPKTTFTLTDQASRLAQKHSAWLTHFPMDTHWSTTI